MCLQHVNYLAAFVCVLEMEGGCLGLIEKGATKTVSFLTSSPLTAERERRERGDGQVE